MRNDDTSMRVLSLDRDADISPERTGVFTSGLVTKIVNCRGWPLGILRDLDAAERCVVHPRGEGEPQLTVQVRLQMSKRFRN